MMPCNTICHVTGVTAADAHLQGKMTYRASLFERETVMRLAAELIGVLEEDGR